MQGKGMHGFKMTRVNLFFKRCHIFILFAALAMKAQVWAQLSSVSVSTVNAAAGSSSIHTITFTTSLALPWDGRVVVTYPSGFNVSGASIASSVSMDGSLAVSNDADRTITITRSGGTDQPGGETETVRIANVTNSQTAGSAFTVTITTQDNAGVDIESGASAVFTVTPGPLDHLDVSGMAAMETAGNSFTLNLAARDAYGNLVTSFTSVADLSDETGTITPVQTTNFTAGLWNGNVTITKTRLSNTITARSGGKAGTSAAFAIAPAALDYFQISEVASPKTAGVPFGLSITAKDVYENDKNDFTGTVILTEPTGTLVIQGSGSNITSSFTAGTWTGNVLITDAETDIRILASGGGQNGTTGYFNVIAASVNSFSISSISDQSAGRSFLITVTALDAYGNRAVSFSGPGMRVNLTHSGAGVLTPAVSTDFSNGAWNGTVSISQTQSNDQITVQDGAGHSGISNPFNIISSTVDHFVFSSIGSGQTAGTAFSLTITAQDAGNNTVTAFNGTANIADLTGTLSIQQVTFTAGVWSGALSVTQARTGDYLTVTALGKSGQSGSFNVNPAALSRFDIANLSSPKTAGSGFAMTITAKDAYNNTVTGFTSTVSIQSPTVTVSPATSGAFSGGVRVQTVTINRAAIDVAVTVSDGSGHSGTTNYFNVVPNALHHFEIENIPDQATGMPFSIRVTAVDANGNTVTGFNGASSTVTITHSGSGSINPSTSSAFNNGIWTGNVIIPQAQTNDRIQVIRTGGSEAGTSNDFDVTPSAVDHFVISSIPATQLAGTSFAVSIAARDANGNLVTTYNGTASLADETATNNNTQITFSAGQWSGSVVILKSQTSNSLTVTGGGKSGTSNSFNVIAAPVDTFQIGMIASPQTAGTPFPLTLTAKDAYGNTATGFTGIVNLDDDTHTIIPKNSTAFNNGVLTQLVSLSSAANDIRIRVDNGSGQEGLSNFFNMKAGAVHHFTIAPVGIQVDGGPFTLHVTARDEYNNPATDFTGTVDLSDLSGTIQPKVSGSFVSGQWSGGVTVYGTRSANTITASQTGASLPIPSGVSNSFQVIAAPGIAIKKFQAVAANMSTPIHSVTTDQTLNWFIKMNIQNLGSADAVLDSLVLRFFVDGQPQSDYQVLYTDIFLGTWSDTLYGGTTDSLLVRIPRTGRQSGALTIKGEISLQNTGTGGTLVADTLTYLDAQSPSQLSIVGLFPSQNEVSSGQQENWHIAAVIANRGGSTVLVDSSLSKTNISFDLGSGWIVTRPSAFRNGSWHLAGYSTDTLTYFVEKTGSNSVGACTVNMILSGREINTGRVISIHTQGSGSARLTIEFPAQLRIQSVKNNAPNAPYVNVSQPFTIAAVLENTGADAIRDLQIQLESNGQSVFPVQKNVDVLPGGETVQLLYTGTAALLPKSQEIFQIEAEGFAENTGALIVDEESPDDSTRAIIQNPVNFHVGPLSTSRTSLLGGQADPWKIRVPVTNSGGAVLDLDAPKAENIRFSIDGLPRSDYGVVAPTGLKQGGLALRPGVTDTLIYTVTSTGRLGGQVLIQAQIQGTDRNDKTRHPGTNEARVTVVDVQEFRIISTQVKTLNMTEAGNGFVNKGQGFQVLVIVHNGLGNTLKNIQIRLESDRSSVIENQVSPISLLRPSMRDSIWYSVTAMNQEAFPETFTATILDALYEGSGLKAPIGPAEDATATVIIQEPAKISMSTELNPAGGVYSLNQEFTLSVSLENTGSASLADKGRVRIKLPKDFSLLSESDTLSIGLEEPASWLIQAPSTAKDQERIIVVLERIPSQRNTKTPALVDVQTVYAEVSIISSRIQTALSITSPAGAADRTLSTGQAIVVRAAVTWDNATDITSRIQLPSGFQTADNLEKRVSSGEIFWQILTPEFASPDDTIRVMTWGVDALQPDVPITAPTQLLVVQTIAKAELSMIMDITAPEEAALFGTVSLGQEFQVRVRVLNNGQADTIGIAAVSLLPLPEGYLTQDPSTKILQSGEAVWSITAPVNPNSAAVSIRAQWDQVPHDENTNTAAAIRPENPSVAVTLVGAWLAVSGTTVPSEGSPTLIPGQKNVRLLALKLENRGLGGDHDIDIESISLNVVNINGEEINPRDGLEAIRIVNKKDTTLVFGSLSHLPGVNPVVIPLDDVNISVDEFIELVVIGDVAAQANTDYFRVGLGGSSHVAARDAYTRRSVPVQTPSGEDLEPIESAAKKIYNPENEPLLWNCPNPFGKTGKETTTITYYLDENAPVSLRIFTLVGDLVWSRNFAASDPMGQAGSHEILWDGANDKGRQVLNGVYFLMMETGPGKVLKNKIAVMR
jgi:hypothetical protein